MSKSDFVPLSQYQEFPVEQMVAQSKEFMETMRRRRTVRDFADRDVPLEVIENCISAAGTAPSGANQQPWHFAIVRDQAIKAQIREAAEEEERSFYQDRAPDEWLEALRPLGTDEHKPFLETAPYLIAIFAEQHGNADDGKRIKHYYVSESVGIATGMLITALHRSGLATLTHTPSPMKFLNGILGRPANERPYILLVVGYPAADAHVPAIEKKPFSTIASLH